MVHINCKAGIRTCGKGLGAVLILAPAYPVPMTAADLDQAVLTVTISELIGLADASSWQEDPR